MICTNCGKEISDSAKLCGFCGHRLKAAPATATLQQRVRKQSGKNTLWVFFGVAAIAVIAVGAYFLFTSLNYKDREVITAGPTKQEAPPETTTGGESDSDAVQQKTTSGTSEISSVLDGLTKEKCEFHGNGWNDVIESTRNVRVEDGTRVIGGTGADSWSSYGRSTWAYGDEIVHAVLFEYTPGSYFAMGYAIGDAPDTDHRFWGINEGGHWWDSMGEPDPHAMNGPLTSLSPNTWYYGLFGFGSGGDTYIIRLWEQGNVGNWTGTHLTTTFGDPPGVEQWDFLMHVGEGELHIQDIYFLNFCKMESDY